MKAAKNDKTQFTESKMLTPQEISDYLDISYNATLTLIRRGVIPSIKIGVQYRVYPDLFRKWLYQNEGCKVAI